MPPLPPPDEPSQFSTVREGVILVEGTLPVDRAKVFVLNPVTNEIFGQFAQEPRYQVEVAAEPEQFLFLWYSVAGVDSDSVGFRVSDLPEVEPAAKEPPTVGPDAGP